MSRNTAKTTDPIWDSRNSDEPQAPQAGEVWGNNSPVFIILKSEAPKKLVLATICIGPGVKDYTASDLQKYLQKRGLKRLGEIQTT